MSTRRTRAGFSLIELMVVVAIVGFSAMAFLPAFGRAMADQDLSRMIRKVLTIARRARGEALDSRTAMLMWVQPSVNETSPATVQLLRSPLSSCLLPSWTTIQATCAATQDRFNDRGVAGGNAGGCIENHSFGADSDYGSGTYNNRMVEEDASTPPVESTLNRAICWGADGVVYTGNSLTLSLADANGASALGDGLRGAIVYVFQLYDGVTPVGIARRLSIPLGGSPSVLR